MPGVMFMLNNYALGNNNFNSNENPLSNTGHVRQEMTTTRLGGRFSNLFIK